MLLVSPCFKEQSDEDRSNESDTKSSIKKKDKAQVFLVRSSTFLYLEHESTFLAAEHAATVATSYNSFERVSLVSRKKRQTAGN